MTNLFTLQAPICKRPMLLYLASSPYAIGALITQKDGGGIKQPVYYVSCTVKDAETHYPEQKEHA